MNIEFYRDNSSFYRLLDTRVKIVFTVFYSVMIFFLRNPCIMAAGFIIPLILITMSAGIDEAGRIILRLLPVVAIIFLFSPLQERSGGAVLSLGNITILTRESLFMSYKVSSRIVSLSAVLMLLLLNERSSDILNALRSFGLSYESSLSVTLTMSFIMKMSLLFSEIREAMSLRLTEGKRGYPIMPSAISFTVSCLRMIPETASLLEERGYGREGFDSGYVKKKTKKIDLLIMIIPVLLIASEVIL